MVGKWRLMPPTPNPEPVKKTDQTVHEPDKKTETHTTEPLATPPPQPAKQEPERQSEQ